MLVAARTPADRQDGRGRVLHASGRESQLPARARVEPLVHADRVAALAARPRPHRRAARRARRGRGHPPDAGSALLQDRRRPRRQGRSRPGRQARQGQARRARPLRPRRSTTATSPPSARCSSTSPAEPEPFARSRGSGGVRDRGACSRSATRSSRPARCAATRRCWHTATPDSCRTAWASGACPRSDSTRCGQLMAAFRGVSHCYQRPTYPDWPYNLFSMTHGRTKAECEAVLRRGRRRDGARRLLGAVLHEGVQEDARLVFHAGGSGVGTGARGALGLDGLAE